MLTINILEPLKVNAGPLAYAETFLGDKEHDYRPEKTKALKSIFLFVNIIIHINSMLNRYFFPSNLLNIIYN